MTWKKEITSKKFAGDTPHDAELLDFAKRFSSDEAFAKAMCDSVQSWEKKTWKFGKTQESTSSNDLNSLYIDIELVWADGRLSKEELMYIFQRLNNKEYDEQNQNIFNLVVADTGIKYDMLGKIYKFLNDLLFFMLKKWFSIKDKADYDFLKENWYKDKIKLLWSFDKVKWKTIKFVWDNLVFQEYAPKSITEEMEALTNEKVAKIFDTDPDIINISEQNLYPIEKILYLYLKKDFIRRDNAKVIDSFKWLKEEVKKDNLVIWKSRFKQKQK